MPEPFVVQPREGMSAATPDVPTEPRLEESPAGRRVRHPALEPFERYLDDPSVTDVFVNSGDGLFVDRGDGARRAPEWRATEEDVRDLAVSLIAAGGRHLDDAAPAVDVRLEGGIRVHAV